MVHMVHNSMEPKGLLNDFMHFPEEKKLNVTGKYMCMCSNAFEGILNILSSAVIRARIFY